MLLYIPELFIRIDNMKSSHFFNQIIKDVQKKIYEQWMKLSVLMEILLIIFSISVDFHYVSSLAWIYICPNLIMAFNI